MFELYNQECSFKIIFWKACKSFGMLLRTTLYTCISVHFSTWKTKHMNWFWTCTRKNPQRWYTIQLLPFLNIRHWRDMKEFTPVKKHSFAPSGTSNVQYQAIWRDMKEPTLVINHSAALRVTKNVQHQALWRDLKGTTAVINNSVAPSVTSTVQH